MPTSLLWSAGVRKEEEATPNDVVAIDNSAASVREITFHDSIPECYDYCDRSKFSFKFEYFWLIWATDFYIHEIKCRHVYISLNLNLDFISKINNS